MRWTRLSRRQALQGLALCSAACAVPPAGGDVLPVGEGEGEGEGAVGEGEGEGEGDGEGEPVAWATTGTAAMVAQASYPDPFVDDPAPGCVLTCDLTLGPCFAESPLRVDISENAQGVPMRLLLRIVDATTCAPLNGATVDLWHCGVDGRYTGDDVVPACAQNDVVAMQSRAFRGTQVADERGVVQFDSCFPGWYPGRALHLHVRVTSTVGVATTQLFFDEALAADIMSTVPLYQERGLPDTSHDGDLLAAQDDPARFILRGERMSDGALLASSTLSIHAAAVDPACAP